MIKTYKKLVKVNNLESDHERYVVARIYEDELWFWGSWDDRNAAERVANQFDNAVVVDMEKD